MTYESRLTLNYSFGTLSAAASVSDTTLSSADFATLPAGLSTTTYIPITLQDPNLKVAEVVWANAHTAAATTITVLRGRESTSSRAWPSGTLWTLAPTVRDGLLSLANRAALPSDPHTGLRTYLQDEAIVVERAKSGWTDVDTRSRVLARGRRTTSSNTSTVNATSVGVLRMPGIPVRANQLYTIATGSLAMHSNASGDNMAALFTYTTDGSTPVATSPALPGGTAYSYSGGAFYLPLTMNVPYVPTVDQTLSLLLCVQRVTGTGGCYIVCDAQRLIDVMVLHHGPDPGNVGVSV